MRVNANGYVSAALLFDKIIDDMRVHVEYEKFLCRTVIDNDITQEFKKNTANHPNKKYAFKYNNPEVEKHTVAGRNDAKKQTNIN